MGLLDSILGNLTGQGGGFGGGPGPRTRGGGTSPIVKALMMLLAAKAFQHYTSGRQDGADGGGRGGGFGGGGGNGGGGGSGSGPWGDLAGSLDPRGGPGQGMGQQGPGPGGGFSTGGGLGGLIPGGLGGLLGGLIGGGGLNAIVDQFRNSGYGNEVDSWVGRGENRRLAPPELAEALGPETIDELERETGLPRDRVLSELADELPDAVDRFTPDGRLPTEEEVSSRWV